MRSWILPPASSLLLLIAMLSGCGQAVDPTAAQPGQPRLPADADPEVQGELAAGLSDIVNDVSIRYAPLDYNYDEDLLKQIDQAEAYLAGGAKGEPPRSMPRLDAQAEIDHLREAIRRWETARGKTLRPEIDALKAEVAARTPGGPAFHPEFHKRFAATFDDFIKYEAAHIQELRNRSIHERAATLFEKYRQQHAALVRYFQETLDRQYPLPAPPAGATSPAAAQPGSGA
jgi:hypothetical protein